MKKALFAVLMSFLVIPGLGNPNPPTPSDLENGAFGIPDMSEVLTTTTKTFVSHKGYIVGFDSTYHEPLFVEYRLDATDLASTISRTNDFRSDPAAPGCATLADYRGSGYDRGHMMPAADAKSSKEAMSESFFLSNMCPQTAALNRGSWKHLEAFLRAQVPERGAMWILTGPAFDRHKPLKTIGNGVVVPTHFWKVALSKNTNGGYSAIGFILPNVDHEVPDFQYTAVSVDAVELATGLDFFDKLPDDTEEAVENHVDLKDWFKTDSTSSVDHAATDSQPTPVVPPSSQDIRVYIRQSGSKYHRIGCSYLRGSTTPMRLSEAKAQGYTPCSRCRPPQ